MTPATPQERAAVYADLAHDPVELTESFLGTGWRCRCRCGWKSPEAPTRLELETLWLRHRAEVAA